MKPHDVAIAYARTVSSACRDKLSGLDKRV